MERNLSSIRRGSSKRVAFLFAHLHKGGMQKAVSNISCALPAEIEQFVAYYGTENPGFEYRAAMVDLDVPGRMGTGLARKAANFVIRARRLQQFIDCNRIDTVVSFGEAANVLNCLAKRKRTVLSVRVSVDEGLRDAGGYAAAYRTMVKRLYRQADVVVPVSQALGEQLQTLYNVPQSKLNVIYNLYDIEKIRKLAAEPLPKAVEPIFAKPTLVNVGSLVAQKGQEFLIRAFAQAARKVSGLQLAIIGQGELEGYLRRLAEEEGVGNAVHFLGFDSNPYRYLARAKAFVLTSRFEGFPNVLAEAMICGLPVIATDCKTGPREILGDSQHGFLLPDITEQNATQVEQEIAASIVNVLPPESAAKYGRLARERAADFSQDRLIQRWVEVL